MASPQTGGLAQEQPQAWALERAGAFSRMRALAWDGNLLYASHAYTLLCADMAEPHIRWEVIGYFRPSWWRNLTVTSRLAFRLVRDGFHALAVLPSGHLVAAVPGAIIALAPGETEFRVSHRLTRGTRPLHITATRDRCLFWGEYFDNPQRDPVHIYASQDRGMTWDIAYTFPKGSIRHVHNVVYDEWENCLWILTGDNGGECRILRASCDLKNLDIVLSGSQQARAAAWVPTPDALYFASDTPFEPNHIYRLERSGNVTALADVGNPSIFGCKVNGSVFFSTMVEPSKVNSQRDIDLYGSRDGFEWKRVLHWKKDGWPMKFFQYGNAWLPDGKNTSGMLALTTVAVEKADLETSLWRL